MNTPQLEALYLVRHGETEWNRAGRMQGRLDSPLTPAGRAHARTNAALLHAAGVEHLLVSNLGRTQETARLINATLGVGMTLDARLAERDCGVWSGLTLEHIAARYPEDWAARTADPHAHRPPGGENLPDMLARVAPLLASLCRLPYRCVALVSHGVMGRVILSHFLALAPAQVATVHQPNDVVYCLRLGAEVPLCEHFVAGRGPIAGFAERGNRRDAWIAAERANGETKGSTR